MNSRVVARLRRAGIDRMTAEDLAAEAVTRALAKGVAFESPEHLFNWTLLVARNLHVDNVRAERRGPEFCDLADHDVATVDVAVVVEQRMQLHRVLDALAGLSPDDRFAVLTEITPADRRDAVRLNVRRHRARARLRAALATVTGLIGLRRLPRGAVAATPVAFATALVTVCLPWTPSPGVHDHRPRATPVQADRVAAGSVPDLGRVSARRVEPARPPATEKTIARPAPVAAPPAHRKIVKVERGPARVSAHEEPTRPDDYLICIDNSRVGAICAGEPIGL